MKVFHYPGCSTCRKARKWLDEQGIDVELIHIVDAPPSKAQLKAALKQLRAEGDFPVRKLFNTSGQSYRGGGFKERLPGMSEGEALDALAADGKLIKRPLLVGDGVALVGFKPEVWAEALT